MDPTVQFLWERRRGGLATGRVQSWAVTLLENGVESEAVCRLAAESDFHWQQEQVLVSQALRDIGHAQLEDDPTLLRAYEQESIRDYLGEKLEGWDLIRRGCELFYETESDEFHIWIALAGDADQHGGQGICVAYRFDLHPFDEVLKSALASDKGIQR